MFNQHFSAFPINIVYTFFYALLIKANVSYGLGVMLYNLSYFIKLCILLFAVNPQKSGENPKRWRNFVLINAFKELSL